MQYRQQIEIGKAVAEVIQGSGEAHAAIGFDDVAQVLLILHLFALGYLEHQPLRRPPNLLGNGQRCLNARLGFVNGIRQKIDRQALAHAEPAGKLDGADTAGLVEAVEQAGRHLGQDTGCRLTGGPPHQSLVGDDPGRGQIDDRLEGHGEVEGQLAFAALAVSLLLNASMHGNSLPSLFGIVCVFGQCSALTVSSNRHRSSPPVHPIGSAGENFSRSGKIDLYQLFLGNPCIELKRSLSLPIFFVRLDACASQEPE